MRSHGTGFLSDLCHVLTNRHVVFHNIEDAVIGAKVTFSVGQTGTNRPPFQYMVLSGKVIGYGSSYTGYDSTANADWAVIKLESSIGSHVGFIPIYQMSTRRLAGRKIITAGYPGAKTRNGDDLSKLYGDLNCEIIGTNPLNGFLYHNCQATYGQSGSPLMAKGDDGIYYALGMPEHRTDITKSEDPNIANVGVSFSSGKDIYISEGDKIVAILKNDRCD
jgi:V8-like Glu-specific endopeptidase